MRLPTAECLYNTKFIESKEIVSKGHRRTQKYARDTEAK
jgi:hypothetical protein